MNSQSNCRARRSAAYAVTFILACFASNAALAESAIYVYLGNPFTEFQGEDLFDQDDRVAGRFSIDCFIAHTAGDCRSLPYQNYYDLGAVTLRPLSFLAGPAALPTAAGDVNINGFKFSTDSDGNIVDWDIDLSLEDPSGVINVDTDNSLDSAAALGAFANNNGMPGYWRRVPLGNSIWAEGNGHIYAVVDLPEAPWQTANADVQDLLPGYHLVTVTSADEEAFIEQLLVDVTGSSGWEWWLGGFQDLEVETDPAAGWQWVTGETWAFTDWRPGEPNDAAGIENHVALDNGAWNDEGTALGIIRGYIAELGTFDDVAAGHWAFSFIEALRESGITRGCGNGNYCPEAPVTRAQMAVFLERGMHGRDFVPSAPSGNVFLDVGVDDFAASFIEQLYADGITAGCGNNNYCPTAEITRDQMAVFLLRAKHGSSYSPPPATGIFADVDQGNWAVHWIEQLAVEGITAGCGGGNYCPDAEVTRDQMAVFLVRTFEL